MKKINFILKIFIIFGLFNFINNIYASTYEIDSYSINGILLDNGDMKIEENIVYNLKESVNGIYKDAMYKYSAKGDSYLPESSRYMASNVKFLNIFYSDNSFNDLKKAIEFNENDLKNGDKGKYSILKKDNFLKSKLYIPGNYGDKKYVRYEIYLKDVVCNYNDAAEIYWNFIGSGFDGEINNLEINLKLENNNKILKLYPHTYSKIDDSYIKDNIATVKINNLDPNTSFDVRLIFDNDNFNTNKIINENYNYEIVNKIEKDMEIGKLNLQKYKNNNIFLIVVGIASSIIIIFISYTTRDVKTKSYKNVTYNSELLNNLEIGEYEKIINNGGYSTANVFNATLLNLIIKKYITFNPRKELEKGKEKYKYYISLNPKKYDEFDKLSEYEKLLINYIFNEEISYDKIENSNEFEMNTRFKEISKNLKLVNNFGKEVLKIENNKNSDKHTSNIKNMVKITLIVSIVIFLISLINLFTLYPKYDKMDVFFGHLVFSILMISGTLVAVYFTRYTVSDKYVETYNKLLGLKKYLNDYSLLKDRMPIELVLWEKYMVFATVFGISKKVLKEFKEELINKGYDTEYIDNYPTYLMLNNFNSSQYLSSSYSTSSGGYEGAGSGGGGGRRRWPEELFRI